MEPLDKSRDALYGYSKDEQKEVQNGPKPWRSDADYFTEVRISAIALIKMVLHARSGGDLEVMGLMQGKIENKIFVITDAFRLPVEGTETRVNAGDEANEYIIQYLSLSRDNGIEDNAVGWYHSHPGYGCWLSGIDVTTQQLQQQQGPYVAVVIDPHRTDSQGRVEIGAFRTYPEGHKPSLKSKASQVIPSEKAEDFGAHADKYYPLKVSVFKSSLDIALLEALWKKYWVATLTQDTLETNRDFTTQQILNLAKRIPLIQHETSTPLGGNSPFDAIVSDTQRVYGEQKRGTIARDIRASLFAGLAEL